MRLTRLTALDGEAIFPLADIKFQAHITHSIEDATLAGFRDAAIAHIEHLSGFALAVAQFRWTIPAFRPRIELPCGPVVSIDDVTYVDGAGAEQAYAGARVEDDAALPAFSEVWPAAYSQVSVTFTAGPPPSDKLAILLTAVAIQFQILNDRGNSDLRAIEGMERALASLLRPIKPVMA